MDDDIEISNPLRLVALDVLMNFFVCVVLLQEAFAIVRHDEASSGGNEPLIDVRYDVREETAPLLSVLMTAPDGSKLEVPLGKVSAGGTLPDTFAAGEVRLIGFSAFGERDTKELLVEGTETTTQPGGLFRVLVLRPMPGDWRIEVRYMNRRGVETWAADGAASGSIKIGRIVSGRRIMAQTGEAVLGFAEISRLPPIHVPQR